MIFGSKKFEMLLACIFLTSAGCAELDLQIKLTHDSGRNLKSSILIKTLCSQISKDELPEIAEISFNPSMVNEGKDAVYTQQTDPGKVNTWRLLNPLPRLQPTQEPTKPRTWQLLNAPQSTLKAIMHFPKEDASKPSPHEYHPDFQYQNRIFSEVATTRPSITNIPTNLKHKLNGKLFEILATKFNNKNLLYSPSSLETMLALLYFGAEGRTAAQLQNVLEYPVTSSELAKQIQESLAEANEMSTDFKFLIASKIYYSDGLVLEPSFKQIASEHFNSDLERINFVANDLAAESINQWVADKTEQRIKHIIDAQTLDAQTQAIMVNAIYLKAKWAKEFSLGDTDRMDFYTRNDLQHAKLVNMMYIEDEFNYGNFPAIDASIVELPFLDSELSMLIIVPNKMNGLQEVERRLKAENLNELHSKMELKKVTLRMPKFKIEAEVDVKEPLEKLGVREIFTTNSELGKIFSNNPAVKISKILHKAFINVNEGGVEAAASTYSQLVPLSLEPNMIYLTADHPFLFAIRSRQAVHFIGHVIDDFQ